jgi:hypothetical protein
VTFGFGESYPFFGPWNRIRNSVPVFREHPASLLAGRLSHFVGILPDIIALGQLGPNYWGQVFRVGRDQAAFRGGAIGEVNLWLMNQQR